YEPSLLLLRGVSKALLPVSGKSSLDWWYQKACTVFKDIYIVTNAINTSALGDIALVKRVKGINEDVVAIAPEFLYHDGVQSDFIDILEKDGDYVVSSSKKDLPSRSIAFGLSHSTLETLEKYTQGHQNREASKGFTLEIKDFILSQDASTEIQIEYSPTFDFMDPDISLLDYINTWSCYFDNMLKDKYSRNHIYSTEPITVRSYARVGLMGNPSDGFYGKTMSLLISNFWSEVVLVPNTPTNPGFGNITFMTNILADPRSFSNMSSLVTVCENDGYDHGDRLLLACCKVLYNHCRKNNIPIDTSQGFTAMYDTNIPRQVGLAGSSAIITAFWKALVKLYRITSQQIPIELQASLVMTVETEELGIAAGLQDRVIQAYGGLVSMDFEKEHMETHGYGKYTILDHSTLPPLWLAYVANPEDSGKVHSTVKQRFLAGDIKIIEGMRVFANLTDKAQESLKAGDHQRFGELMTCNFENRRSIYGDDVVGKVNLRMIEIARQNHCDAKFSGSGGAIVGMWNGSNKMAMEGDLLNLKQSLEKEGFVYVDLIPMGRQS
ncbi:ribosomal protein S5 domain 2-type protein, partial [Phycomyces nitens]